MVRTLKGKASYWTFKTDLGHLIKRRQTNEMSKGNEFV